MTMWLQKCPGILLALLLAPAVSGVINKVKALFAGRRGPPVLQLYFDLFKLLAKGAVYSRTTSWLFRAGPVVSVAALISVLLIIPFGGPSLLSFPGDLAVGFYLLAIARFFTVLAAMDTGSSFEGMGASREVQFSALAEPALFLGFAVLIRMTGQFSFSEIFGSMTASTWATQAPALILVAVVLMVVLLAENARIPVDDPNTHLELTMIHEVMVLDHGGPDFALILYASSLKLWVFASWFAGLVVPRGVGSPAASLAATLGGVLLAAVLVGVIESIMARLRLLRVPQLLLGAAALAAVALLLVMK
ncbi:MAG TPA: NADH-quinone oxidoreductase subunit H [Kiritimatiellia bacterium]|nr:NADH-quinone oxidoreductase subunit H [Kiritimatiellia bacterium]